MEGSVEVQFSVLCENDFTKEVSLEELLSSEKVQKAIRSEFCEGARNLVMDAKDKQTKISIHSDKKLYTHEIDKNDIQDILELTEEYARVNKLLKGSCNRVELKDFKTVEA